MAFSAKFRSGGLAGDAQLSVTTYTLAVIGLPQADAGMGIMARIAAYGRIALLQLIFVENVFAVQIFVVACQAVIFIHVDFVGEDDGGTLVPWVGFAVAQYEFRFLPVCLRQAQQD